MVTPRTHAAGCRAEPGGAVPNTPRPHQSRPYNTPSVLRIVVAVTHSFPRYLRECWASFGRRYEYVPSMLACLRAAAVVLCAFASS